MPPAHCQRFRCAARKRLGNSSWHLWPPSQCSHHNIATALQRLHSPRGVYPVFVPPWFLEYLKFSVCDSHARSSNFAFLTCAEGKRTGRAGRHPHPAYRKKRAEFEHLVFSPLQETARAMQTAGSPIAYSLIDRQANHHSHSIRFRIPAYLERSPILIRLQHWPTSSRNLQTALQAVLDHPVLWSTYWQ